MKNYKMKNASYRGIPCWYSPIDDVLIGKNWVYNQILSLVLWFDVEILDVKEFPIWVEVDDLEKQ